MNVASPPTTRVSHRLPDCSTLSRFLPESGASRSLYDCPDISLTEVGPPVRVIVAPHPATSTKPPVGGQHARLALTAMLRVLESLHETTEMAYASAQAQVEHTLARLQEQLAHQEGKSGISASEHIHHADERIVIGRRLLGQAHYPGGQHSWSEVAALIDQVADVEERFIAVSASW